MKPEPTRTVETSTAGQTVRGCTEPGLQAGSSAVEPVLRRRATKTDADNQPTKGVLICFRAGRDAVIGSKGRGWARSVGEVPSRSRSEIFSRTAAGWRANRATVPAFSARGSVCLGRKRSNPLILNGCRFLAQGTRT